MGEFMLQASVKPYRKFLSLLFYSYDPLVSFSIVLPVVVLVVDPVVVSATVVVVKAFSIHSSSTPFSSLSSSPLVASLVPLPYCNLPP